MEFTLLQYTEGGGVQSYNLDKHMKFGTTFTHIFIIMGKKCYHNFGPFLLVEKSYTEEEKRVNPDAALI